MDAESSAAFFSAKQPEKILSDTYNGMKQDSQTGKKIGSIRKLLWAAMPEPAKRMC
ncbi:hypothetical protein ACFS07_33280 [Undibacterium arcticum]